MSPVTVQLSPDVVQVRLPGVDVTVYAVIGSPLADDAIHDTVDDVSPLVATTPVGAVGKPAGITGAVATDGADDPAALLDTTVTV